MYNCTKCSNNLVKCKIGRFIQYQCPNCNSQYLSFSALRNLGYVEFVKSIWPKLVHTKNSTFSCPFCNKKQSNLVYDSNFSQFPIEVCKQCQFIWFDVNELSRLKKDIKKPFIPKDENDKKLIAKLKTYDMANNQNMETKFSDTLLAILGLPVEYNQTRLKNIPIITYSLVALLSSIFLINYLTFGFLNTNFTFTPNTPFKYFGFTLFTCFFLHANIWHLLGNLYFLYIFGDNVEDKISRFSYIFLILCGHIFGVLLNSLISYSYNMPILGASAGISAILAFYVYLYPDIEIGIFLLYEYIRVNAAFLFVFWICKQIMLSMFQIDGLTLVAGLAHLGGAIIGFSFAITYFKPQKSTVNSR